MAEVEGGEVRGRRALSMKADAYAGRVQHEIHVEHLEHGRVKVSLDLRERHQRIVGSFEPPRREDHAELVRWAAIRLPVAVRALEVRLEKRGAHGPIAPRTQIA